MVDPCIFERSGVRPIGSDAVSGRTPSLDAGAPECAVD